ncbi:MAG: NADH-quinone oxidoreductase subunit N [Phototrophicales bacterium]|nr:MAG: NADH-quinone oxidoreductase subunit N [Phototrophicales bacterium]
MIDVPSFAELNLEVALPGIFLALFTTVLLIVDLFIPKDRKITTAHLTIGALVVAFVLNLPAFNAGETAMNEMFIADAFAGFVNMIVITGAIITVLLSVDYMKRSGIEHGEFYSLLLFSVSGIMFMGSANDLIVVFIALELLSIPLYVMAALRHDDVKSEESGIKYFILGAFASAFFVYGAALIYGATGTTNLPEIFRAIAGTDGIVATENSAMIYLVIGAAMVIVALGFKVAAVPFHMWTPDVYEGAPTPVTAFMSVGAKAGGFAGLLRVMIIGLPLLVVNFGDAVETMAIGETITVPSAWQTALWLIAAATMIFGNFIAISQTNVKRMLAYSSIAHAGYILMAVAAVGTVQITKVAENDYTMVAVYAESALNGALVYLLAYTFTNLGAFAVVMSLENNDGSGTMLDDFNGLSKRHPLTAAMMAFFMLSLIGVPTTAGFIGKFLIFDAAIQAGLIPLTIIGVLTSAVSAYYYVRIIVNMYLKDAAVTDEAVGLTPYVNYATIVAFAGTLIFGLFPMLALDLLASSGAQIATLLF